MTGYFFSKNIENIIEVFSRRRWRKVKKGVNSEEHSAPSADISTAPAASKRQTIVSTKVEQKADGYAASKVDLTKDSEAMLTLGK